MKSLYTIFKSGFTHPPVYIFQFPFQVLEDQYNPRLIKDLLQDLSSTLCMLIRSVGKSVLVGNINIWICRLETILLWQQQLSNLQMTKVHPSFMPLLYKTGKIIWKYWETKRGIFSVRISLRINSLHFAL